MVKNFKSQSHNDQGQIQKLIKNIFINVYSNHKILPRSIYKLISSKISQISKILKNSLHSFVSIYAVSFSSHSLQQTLFSVSRFRREQCESQSYSVYTLAAQWQQYLTSRGYNIIPNFESQFH